MRRPLAALWLILATIFAHALLPVGSPMARASGSAFSAATVDVSIVPARSGADALSVGKEGGSSSGAAGSDPPQEFVAIATTVSRDLPQRAADPPTPAAPEPSPLAASAQPYAPRAPPLS